MNDRREFQRWKCLIPCVCSGDHCFLAGRVVDLSFGGACVTYLTELPNVGSELEVAFDGNFSLKAKVIYLNLEKDYPKLRDHFGLQFCGKWQERIGKLKLLFERYLEN